MRRRLGWATAFAAALLALHAFWIPLKARAAQALLARAWLRAEAAAAEPRPWPWADTWPVARLAVRRLGVDAIVLAGASGSSLAFGPGHVSGTAMPGTPGNSVVAGHRDTVFRFLERLRQGDAIVVDRPDGRRSTYLVETTTIVDAADPAPYADDGDTLTLVTCWPFGALRPGGRERYVVRARRLQPTVTGRLAPAFRRPFDAPRGRSPGG